MKKLVYTVAAIGAMLSPAVAQLGRTVVPLPTQCSAVPGHFEQFLVNGKYKLQSFGILFPPTGTYEFYMREDTAFAMLTRTPQGSSKVTCLVLEGSKVMYPPDDEDIKPAPEQH